MAKGEGHRSRRGVGLCILATSMAVTLLAVVVGCGAGSDAGAWSEPAGVEAVAGTGERPATQHVKPLLEPGDFLSGDEGDADFDEATATRVALSDGATAVEGVGAGVAGDVLAITEGGTYVLSGTLTNGHVAVDAPGGEVRIVLDGADVTSADGAALYVADAAHVTLTLVEGSRSSLACAGEFAATDDGVDAVVFSHDGLTVNGGGVLEVTAGAGGGVASKDELVFAGGTVSVACTGDALAANDWIAVTGGELRLGCEGDALHVESDDAGLGFVYLGEGTVAIAEANDGVHASGAVQVDGGKLSARVADDALHSDADLQIAGGTVVIAESHEGLEAATVTITDGSVSIVAADDGINATGVSRAADGGSHDGGAGDDTAVLAIAGGTLTIDSDGDGIDSNGTIAITGGTTAISAATSGADNTAIDCAISATIDGGAIIACGRAEGALGFARGSAQTSALVRLGDVASGEVELDDAAGNLLASFTPAKPYESVIVSTPDLEPKGAYLLACGDATYNVRL